MTAYRESSQSAAIVPVGYPPALHAGKRRECPACGSGIAREHVREYDEKGHLVYYNYVGAMSPTACSWWRRLWGCREKRDHLHQACNNCGSKWIVGYAERTT